MAWRNDMGPGRATVGAAFTSDAGAHWGFTTLHDPSLAPRPMRASYSWDSVARFGPDGIGYVLYGGEPDYVCVASAARV